MITEECKPMIQLGHSLCMYDRLSVYQSNSSSSGPIGRYCGNEIPAPIISKEVLLLQFRTDSTIGSAGFKIDYITQRMYIFVAWKIVFYYIICRTLFVQNAEV